MEMDSARSEFNSRFESATSSAFGAEIDVALPVMGMYLVQGYGPSVTSRVVQDGGQVFFEIGPETLLALLSVDAYFAYRRDPDVKFVGPVTLDQERFNQFVASIAATQSQ